MKLEDAVNATKAAIDAGYSEKTAYSIASEILRIPEVDEAIKAGISERAMGPDEVLLRLGQHARASDQDWPIGRG